MAEAIGVRGGYVVSLGGITLGRGWWEVRLDPQHYSATGGARSSGLMRLFSAGEGEARASGTFEQGRPLPARYDYTSRKSDKFDEVHLQLHDHAVVHSHVEPPQRPSHKRVPVEDSHRRGVFDPISAVLMPVPGSADAMGPQACARQLHVFDGRMRYDLRFSFKRQETVKTEQGYQGPATVCGLQFVPIAGHVPDRPAIKHLMQVEGMEIWLTPVAGTRLVVPWQVAIPTPFGTAKMQAERFEVSRD